jgi:hypothetical protein
MFEKRKTASDLEVEVLEGWLASAPRVTHAL